jgi:hypothetical protein
VLRLVAVLLSLALSNSTQSAFAPTSIPKDAAAFAAMQSAIAAMGGAPPSDSIAVGTITTVAGSTTENGTVVFQTRGSDQTSEQIQTSSGFTSVYSQGRASLTASGSSSTLPVESAITTQCPYFLLPLLAASIANPDTAFKYVALETTNGSSVQHVQFWNTFSSIPDLQPLAEFSHRDLWLDATSGLPRRISFTRRPAGASGPSLRVDVMFSDYRNVGGLFYPYSIHVALNGTAWASISIQNVALNTGLTDNSFSIQ